MYCTAARAAAAAAVYVSVIRQHYSFLVASTDFAKGYYYVLLFGLLTVYWCEIVINTFFIFFPFPCIAPALMLFTLFHRIVHCVPMPWWENHCVFGRFSLFVSGSGRKIAVSFLYAYPRTPHTCIKYRHRHISIILVFISARIGNRKRSIDTYNAPDARKLFKNRFLMCGDDDSTIHPVKWYLNFNCAYALCRQWVALWAGVSVCTVRW